jgi:hypothetical protein
VRPVSFSASVPRFWQHRFPVDIARPDTPSKRSKLLSHEGVMTSGPDFRLCFSESPGFRPGTLEPAGVSLRDGTAFEPGFDDTALPRQSVALMFALCLRYGVEPAVRSHPPSFSAAQKQRIVAPAQVQKTVTVRLGDSTLLCTAIGDPLLSRDLMREVAERLGLARASVKRLHINPPGCDPLIEFGMAPGMVSPWLRPGRPTSVRAIVLTGEAAPAATDETAVALSLSLRQSLFVPARIVPAMLRDYAARAYPQVAWIDLRRETAVP